MRSNGIRKQQWPHGRMENMRIVRSFFTGITTIPNDIRIHRQLRKKTINDTTIVLIAFNRHTIHNDNNIL